MEADNSPEITEHGVNRVSTTDDSSLGLALAPTLTTVGAQAMCDAFDRLMRASLHSFELEQGNFEIEFDEMRVYFSRGQDEAVDAGSESRMYLLTGWRFFGIVTFKITNKGLYDIKFTESRDISTLKRECIIAFLKGGPSSSAPGSSIPNACDAPTSQPSPRR